jgi:DNA-binding IclR family transcriptional regulator
MMREGSAVASVDRCLSIIEAVASAGKPVGVSALARQLGLPKATVHRICRSLMENGFAAQDDRTRRYHAGWRLYGLAARALTGAHLPRVVNAAMRELSMRTGGHAFFAQLSPDGRHLLVVAEQPSQRLPHIDSCLGWVFPADRAPAGLACLRGVPAPRPQRVAAKPTRKRLIDDVGDEGDVAPPQTQREPNGLFHVHRDFLGPGLHCAASLVHDDGGRPCGSLGVIFAEAFLDSNYAESPGPLCAQMADNISRSLVHVPT